MDAHRSRLSNGGYLLFIFQQNAPNARALRSRLNGSGLRVHDTQTDLRTSSPNREHREEL